MVVKVKHITVADSEEVQGAHSKPPTPAFNKLFHTSLEFQEILYAMRQTISQGGPRGRVVKVADFSALDHSIISPMWVRASHGARIHM